MTIYRRGWEGYVTVDDVSYHVDATLTVSEDHNYGADADGNRGWYLEELEEITIDSAIDEDDRVVNVEKEEELVMKLIDEVYKEI